jgi:hypothetical protein
MRRFSNVLAIVLSIFSGDLYRDVGRTWRGVGAVYLLVVTVVCGVPVLISMQAGMRHVARTEAGPILDQIPLIVLHDGRASTNAPMPVVIRDSGGRALAILDTTGQISSLDSTEARVLVTSTRAFLRRRLGVTEVYDLSLLPRFEVDRVKATRWVRGFLAWAALLVSPFVIGMIFLFRLVQVAAFALVGMLLAGRLGARPGFAALMRLSAVAFTPMILLDALRGAAGLHVPLWPLLSMVIALVYVIFAIRANRETGPAAEGMTPPQA